MQLLKFNLFKLFIVPSQSPGCEMENMDWTSQNLPGDIAFQKEEVPVQKRIRIKSSKINIKTIIEELRWGLCNNTYKHCY